MTVEVFKTDINSRETADALLMELQRSFPECRISFDLEDCDRILRVAGCASAENIILVLRSNGHLCEMLEH